ncbi:MAG: hypothetical protein JWQ36_1527 [Enterovirga sp.]|jgi:hypothetical protein|nr:hypothetical protein [Enterovirga sp.]
MLIAVTCWLACLAAFLEFAERAPVLERID